MAERHSLTTLAQLSLTPLGTCLRVGQGAWKMVVREGKSRQTVGGKDESGRWSDGTTAEGPPGKMTGGRRGVGPGGGGGGGGGGNGVEGP